MILYWDVIVNLAGVLGGGQASTSQRSPRLLCRGDVSAHYERLQCCCCSPKPLLLSVVTEDTQGTQDDLKEGAVD